MLLARPSAPAKSRIPWDLERTAGDRALWVLGSSSSNAGLQERLLGERPWLLLIDELDRMEMRGCSVLLALMEGGVVARLKKGMNEVVRLDTRVFAGANCADGLVGELRSRFLVLRLPEYSEAEFKRAGHAILALSHGSLLLLLQLWRSFGNIANYLRAEH